MRISQRNFFPLNVVTFNEFSLKSHQPADFYHFTSNLTPKVDKL